MGAIYVSWGISGAVFLAITIAVGLAATSRLDGILIDERGRYSLTHLQLCLWTIVILSLIAGVFFGRLVHGVTRAAGLRHSGRRDRPVCYQRRLGGGIDDYQAHQGRHSGGECRGQRGTQLSAAACAGFPGRGGHLRRPGRRHRQIPAVCGHDCFGRHYIALAVHAVDVAGPRAPSPPCPISPALFWCFLASAMVRT